MDSDAVETSPRLARRPPGLPSAGVPALVCLYLLLGIVPAIGLMLSGYFLHSPHDELLAHFLPYLACVSTLLLTTIIGLGRAAIWAIKLFRFLAWLIAALMATDVAAALLIISGQFATQPGARNTALFALAVIVTGCLPAWILFSKIRSVRWLDPRSLPHEWEPPVARAPR